ERPVAEGVLPYLGSYAGLGRGRWPPPARAQGRRASKRWPSSTQVAGFWSWGTQTVTRPVQVSPRLFAARKDTVYTRPVPPPQPRSARSLPAPPASGLVSPSPGRLPASSCVTPVTVSVTCVLSGSLTPTIATATSLWLGGQSTAGLAAARSHTGGWL